MTIDLKDRWTTCSQGADRGEASFLHDLSFWAEYNGRTGRYGTLSAHQKTLWPALGAFEDTLIIMPLPPLLVEDGTKGETRRPFTMTAAHKKRRLDVHEVWPVGRNSPHGIQKLSY